MDLIIYFDDNYWHKVDDGNEAVDFSTDSGASDQIGIIQSLPLLFLKLTVSNTGWNQIDDLTFIDTLTSARGVPLSLDSQPVFVSGTNGSTATTLALGGVITYTATFTVTQQVLDEGGVYNTITFSGSSARNPNPAEHDTEDVSDDDDDTDGNTEDDPTFFAVGDHPIEDPSIEVTKTDNDQMISVGDVLDLLDNSSLMIHLLTMMMVQAYSTIML